ncbi:helix-turn-helix domain-containing protein [Candidatus Parcubacteria bacterium]|nr:helix-turn-helix domain-containing protein [Candidatus Parcubacteria bacterium]
MIELEDKLYSSNEVAKILGVSLRSVYRYIENGRLAPETQTMSGRHRFNKNAILKFLYPQPPPQPKKSFLASSGAAPTSRRVPKTEETPPQHQEEAKPQPKVETKPEFKFYYSPVGGLKEVARSFEQAVQQTGRPYAFTIYGGLSLHYEIRPFSIIHVYIRQKDLDFFQKRLKLKPSSKERANLGLMAVTDESPFKESRKLRNLTVVSDHRLLQDLLGYSEESKVLAREFARKGGDSHAR